MFIVIFLKDTVHVILNANKPHPDFIENWSFRHQEKLQKKKH